MMLIQVHQLKQNVITLVVDVGNRAMYVAWVKRVHGKSLHFSLNFAVNLKLSPQKTNRER